MGETLDEREAGRTEEVVASQLRPVLDLAGVAAFAGALIPIYPAAGSVTTWQVQSSVGILLDQLPDLADPVPAEILDARGLCGLSDALRLVHRPSSRADVARAHELLAGWRADGISPVSGLHRFRRQLDPANGLALAILFPARPREIAAHDALDGERPG